MKETITSIEELNDFEYKDSCYDGYKVETTKNNYLLLISSYQQCCESWGYATTEEKTKDFIGAEVLSVDTTSSKLKNFNLDDYDYLEREASTLFLTFNTSKGKLQFVVYNAHNGYYSHNALIVKNDKTEEDAYL